mgnify:CR=1 FL=1
MALRAFVRSRLNLFAHVNLTCLKYSQVEKIGFCMLLPEHNMDPTKYNSVFSCIHSLRKVFQKNFKTPFWTIVPFLLKLSFFLTDFSLHEILLEHMGPKILSPVPVNWHKTPKISGRSTDGDRTSKFKRVPHKSPSGKNDHKMVPK